MSKIMFRCTYNGKPVAVAESGEIDDYIGAIFDCPNCCEPHVLKRLYLEGEEPSEKQKFNVALESALYYASEIGVFISCFALLEGYMPQLLEKLTGLSKEDAAEIMGNLNMSARVDLLKNLAEQRGDSDQAKQAVSFFAPKIREAISIRNKYAHAEYSIAHENVFVKQWKYDSKRKTKEYKETLRDAAIAVETIQSLICDLHGYIYRGENPQNI